MIRLHMITVINCDQFDYLVVDFSVNGKQYENHAKPPLALTLSCRGLAGLISTKHEEQRLCAKSKYYARRAFATKS